MGLYWTTIIYYGRMCSPEAYDRLMSAKLHFSEKSYLTKVSSDRWILHAPTRCCVVASIDPIIEQHEKSRGNINMEEALKFLATNRPEKKEKWDSMAEDEEAMLQMLIHAASDKTTKEKPGVYMCEVSWSTLDCSAENPHNFGDRVTFNLRCT